ncbi:hypothetical protein P7C73_g5463, partial [Tremellales sp. Uapishka_1]
MSASATSTSSSAASRRTVFDPASPLFVASSVMTTTTIGALSGGTLGVIRAQNPFQIAINMGINCGVAGLSFFGIREYLVSPLLLSIGATAAHRRRAEVLSWNQFGKLPELGEADDNGGIDAVRWNRMWDSALSGGLAGAALSGGLRGRQTIPRAFLTSSLLASLLQFSMNQLRVIRLELLASRNPPPVPLDPPRSTPDLTTAKAMVTSMERPQKTIPTTAEAQVSLPGRIMNALSHFLPVNKLSDQEYLEVLEKNKAKVARKLQQIEEEELAIFDQQSEDVK